MVIYSRAKSIDNNKDIPDVINKHEFDVKLRTKRF